MFDLAPDDTIIAVSTPPGRGGLGVVRLSGDRALEIALRFFRPKDPASAISPRKAVLGKLVDPESLRPFDEAYLLDFPAPFTYTRQHVVEISAHGSPAVLEEVLRLGARFGARLARPGEFTLRAYLGGRIDILQAEAVDDLIRASGSRAARMAFGQLDGGLSARMYGLKGGVMDILAHAEAAIEFPEENLPISRREISSLLKSMAADLEKLIASYDAGRSLLEGVTLAIAGRTNVGKSTLFNALLEHERAIVTPFPGTTRDFLREKIRIEDIDFNLIDMAGLRKPSTSAEKEGIRRGRDIAARADGVLVLLDASRRETAEDIALVEEFREKRAILVFNKADLGRKMDTDKLGRMFGRRPKLAVSALKGTNLGKLKTLIYRAFAPGIDEKDDVIFHLRQKLALEDIFVSVRAAERLLAEGQPEEIFIEEIRRILPVLGKLVGEIRADDVLNDIFSRFCVGK
jgi:tRNA modification GTPase